MADVCGGSQIAKAATDEGNVDVAQEVVARIPALADYKAAQGDTRLLETLERSDFQITGDASLKCLIVLL